MAIMDVNNLIQYQRLFGIRLHFRNIWPPCNGSESRVFFRWHYLQRFLRRKKNFVIFEPFTLQMYRYQWYFPFRRPEGGAPIRVKHLKTNNVSMLVYLSLRHFLHLGHRNICLYAAFIEYIYLRTQMIFNESANRLEGVFMFRSLHNNINQFYLLCKIHLMFVISFQIVHAMDAN